MKNEMKIEELKRVVEEMPEGEVKSLLFHILLRLKFVKETTYSEMDFINDVENLYETLFKLSKERSEKEKEEDCQRIHILFGDSCAGSLKIALKKKGLYPLEKIISIRDIYSIGPVYRLHEEEGQEFRFNWMKSIVNDENGDSLDYYVKEFQELVIQISSVQEDIPITVWISDSAHEQTGLLYVLYLLKNKGNKITVINTTEKYSELFTSKDIEFTILHTGEISLEKLQVIYEQSKKQSPLSQHQRRDLENDWLSLSKSEDSLRIWTNGQILSVAEDFYDNLIIERAECLHRKTKLNDFMKSARLIGEVLGHLEQYVGDSFIEFRLKKLIEAGVFEVEGSLKAMRYYSVRLKR
ncbi:DUF1835 domain-containing protein [Sporosarcina sp. ITBMC105]